MFAKGLYFCLLMHSITAVAIEYKWHGVIDFRVTKANSLASYIDGGYGKFNSNNGKNLSLAQVGIEFTADWDSGLSAHVVSNGYSNESETIFGVTEAFLKYRSIPNSSGYRWQTKIGMFYPEISLENNAFAWASKNTSNSSAINTWVGEELRIIGSELSLTRLGKFFDAQYDFTLAASAFINNDTAGALLSWHGWNIGNRQTLWKESRPIADFQARRSGNNLDKQSENSEPFLEIDNKIGIHLTSQINFHHQGHVALGYYDNLASPYIIEDGQYVWRTRFSHIGFKWRLIDTIELSGQYLSGDTLMQNTSRVDVVNNDYSAAYLALSKKIEKHRLTLRLEEFLVNDNDQTSGDNNYEYGKSITTNYSYRFNKPWFLSFEYNWIASKRPARSYTNSPVRFTEYQWQWSVRYFF